MPIYRVNGNRYNIPDDKIQDFESYYPEAKVEIYDGEGGKYALPLSIRNEFQQRYEKWSYVTEETKKESPNTFVSNQNPQNTIISEDELENSMADYEESLGHGKYGAANTPLFQKVRQSATSAEQIADGIIDKNWISKSPSPSVSQGNIGGVPEGRGVSNSSSNRTPVSDAYKSQFDKTIEDRFADARTRLEKDVVFQFENMLNKIEEDINENSEWRNESEQIENEGDIFKNYKGYKNITEDTIEDLEREGYVPKEIGELSQKRSVQNLTRKYISEARDVIEMYKRKDGNGLANFADAFARSFDSGILTLGATDAIDMGRLLAIANKIGDNGEGFEKLTKEEQQLMAAFSLLDQIQGSLQLDTWQNIGRGTMQSLPFLAQFALTGGVGAAASAATKAAAKTAVKKIIGKSASKAVSRIAANAGKNAAGRVAVKAASKLGNAAIDGLVGGTVMALTSGAGHTAEDVMSRMVGNHDIRLDSINDPGGELKTIYTHHGVEDRESLGLAFLKGFAANLIENGTEYMGNYMGLNLGKLLSRFKGGRQLLTKPLIGKTTRFARQVGKLTGFNGFIPEVAEEELGMLLNAATVGDVEWKDIKDPEQQFQTVMAVGIMSLGFQVANSIGVGLTYNKYRKAKKRYESKDLGEGLSVDDIIHGLDNVPLDRRADYVMAMVNTHDLGKGDAKDLQDFVMARTGYEFILGKIESDAEEAGDKAAEAEMRLINKEMGGKVTVTLSDGREAILTVGNVSLEPNAAGEYTTTTQSGSLIAVPVGIGNTPIMVSPKDIRSVSIMSTEDAVGQARAMAEDITKTNMASQIENETDEVESDEQSRTPSSTMSGGEIGELSPRDEGVEKQPLYRKSELEIGDVVTFKDYSDPDNPGVERTLKIIGIDDSGVDVEDVVDGVPLPLSIKPEQITHVKGKEKRQTTGGDEIRLWDYITYLDEETGKQKQGRVIEISPEGEISVQVRDEELNYPYTKYVSPENIIGKYKPQEQTGNTAEQRTPSSPVSPQGNIGEVAQPEVLNPEQQTAPQSETDTSEYTRFVEDGTVLRIANKIANGEQLTREEEAMRQEVSQRVEDKLREIQQNVEGKEETDRWAKYRKSNGEVDEKKMSLREQFEYGEEIAGVKAMIEVAKAGTKKTQSEIARLEKEIEREISPVKRVNKEKQLKSLNERLGTYQQYLEDNNSDLQSLKATPANIVDRIAALGDIKSLRDYILRLVATGNIKFKWGDTDSSKGLASHLGINDSPGERRKRISLLSNSGYTPEQLAHNIWEQQDVQNSDLPFKGYETDEILDEILDVMSSVYSPSKALELAEQIANEDLRKQEMASQDYESHELEQSSIEQIELEPLPDDLAPRNNIAFRRNESGETPSGQTQINERESNSDKENSLSSQEEKQIDSQDEILPFGEIYIQFKGKPREAIDFLMKKKSGEAIGALYHKDVGDIDLVWGKEGTGHSDGFGLAKLVKYHPEVLDNLQDILNDMQVTTRNSNRINLESTTHKATIRLEWDGNKKNWLLTAFEKENPASTKTTDTDTTSLRGGTALSQTGFSAGKDNTGASNKQEKPRLSTQKTLQERRQEIQEYIEREAGKLNIPVRIVGDVSQISPSEKNYTKKLTSQGWYDQTTGEIVIVTPNHGSIRDAQRTLLHETVAHYGLPAMLGRENFDKLCDQVWDSMTDRERAVFGAYIDEKIDDKSYNSLTEEEKERYAANDFSGKRAAADEYLAHFAEEGITNPSLWSKIKRFIKEAFRKIGIDLSLTDSDIAYLLWKSKNRITDKDSTTDIIRKSAADTRIKESLDERFRTVYHGSPHDFDRFDHSFMSTGEGAQAYGWGTYVTEVNGIAKSYAENLTGRDYARQINRLAQHIENRKDFIKTRKADIRRNEDYEKYAKTIRKNLRDSQKEYKAAERAGNEKDMEFYQSLINIANQQLDPEHHKHLVDSFWDDINNAQADIDQSNTEIVELKKKLKDLEGKRNLYTVEIPDDTGENYLDWEQPVSDKQAKAIEHAAKQEFDDEMADKIMRPIIKGNDFNRVYAIFSDKSRLGSDKAASEFLSRAGFTGIKYPAQATTGGRSDGARNYVIFNENDLQITDHTRFRIREEEPPKNTGIGYKVFVLKNGKLYPPMVANPNGEDTPVGVWLDADAAPIVSQSKTGRNQVKAGGKGTQGGSGKLAYRPGWHLGEIPYAIQFNRKNPITGEKELFPANFVWAEVEYAKDVDYQQEAYNYGLNANGNYQHSLAGLPYLPTNGSYKYRTNPNPETDPWIITGSIRVKRLLTPSEVDEIVSEAGREIQQREEGAVTDVEINSLNKKLNLDSIRFRTIVVNPRYGSKIETVRTNHTSVYKAVDKYLRENFDEKDYTTHTAKTGSRYLELNIGNDTLKVRFANHTPRMEASDNMYTIGNGKEITFFPGGDIEVEIDISLSGDRSKEIIDLIKGMKEYSSSEVKKEVSSLIDGAKTDPFPDVASPQLIEELSHYIGTEMAGTLDTQIAEYYKYRVNENVYKQESKSRDSKLKQNKYVLEQYKTIFRDFVQESPKLIKAVGGGYWYNGATGSIRIVPPFPIDYGLLSDKLMSSHFIPIPGINKKEGKRQIVQEYVDEWSRRLTDSGIFLSEEYVSEGAKITEAQQEIDNIREQYNFWVKAKLNTGTSADIRYRTAEDMEEVNQRFNEELAELTEENAQSKILYLGRPNEILSSVGIPDKELKLYGNKLIAKAKKHGFDVNEVKDLPQFMDTPIMVFSGSQPNSFAILTELPLNGKNVLVSIGVGKGVDVDFNIVTSVYGKKDDSIIRWINSGNLLYVDREKALNYLRIPAPIAGAQDNSELLSATNIVENFENPKLAGENSDGTMNTRFRREAPDVSSYIKISMDRKGVVNLSAFPAEQADRIRKLAEIPYGAKISGDIASFPDYQSAEDCLIYIFNNNDIISDDISNAKANNSILSDITGILDRKIKWGGARRVWVDEYQPLKALQNLIEKKTGISINNREDAWDYTGQMEAVSASRLEEYKRNYYIPLLEAYSQAANTDGIGEEMLLDYIRIKSGIERNARMRREALERWDKENEGKNMEPNSRKNYIAYLSTQDYSGYYEHFKEVYAGKYNAPQDFVDYIESVMGNKKTLDLWQKINNATHRILDISVHSGLLSKESADEYKSRDKFYVPLRGFEGETMDEAYNSNVRPSSRSVAAKKAEGRTSMADNPIAYIFNIAATEIDRSGKNIMKRKLLELLSKGIVKNHFCDYYWVKYKDGHTEKLFKKPRENKKIEEIIPVKGVYSIRQKYERAKVDENGNLILDREMNPIWEETDEIPTAEELEKGLARISRARKPAKSPIHKTRAQLLESTVDVYVSGERVSIEFTNPIIANSLNGTLNIDGISFEGMARLNRYMSRSVTSWNPGFVLVNNALRDLGTASANTAIEHGIIESARANSRALHSIAALRRVILKREKIGTYTDKEISDFLIRMKSGKKMTKEDYNISAYLFIANGGETGYIGEQNIDEYRKFISDAVKYKNTDSKKQGGILKKLWKSLAKFVENTGRITEDITRLNQFIMAIREGDSMDKSISRAKNVSTNFNRRGSHEGVQWLFDSVMFLNAALQGIDRQWQIAKKHPWKTLGLAVTFPMVVGFVTAWIASVWGSDDDDRWGDSYHQLSSFKRYNNFVFPKMIKGGFITIPLPQIFRAFHAWGVMIYDSLFYNPAHPLITEPITALDFALALGQDVVPFTYGSWTNIGFSFTQPAQHAIFNESFTGAPLYKESLWNENVPEWRKAYGNTSDVFVNLSKWINEMTGGNYAEKGWFEQNPVLEKLNNPAVVQQLVLGYTGGPGSFIIKSVMAGEAAYDKLEGNHNDFSISEVPLVGSLVGEANDRIPKAKLRSKWYEFANKARDSKRADSELLKELFIDEFIENTRDSDKVLNKSVYDGLNVHIRNLMKLEGIAETWEDDLVSGDLPADEAIRTSAEIVSLRNTIDNTLYDIINELKIAQ